jgi:LmbE family N-acetylglucosaminyl deacetylase
MATVLCFHAHPDDEAIATGGLMASAAAAGHRVVLVTATKGEQGEYPQGFLNDGEQLATRRVQELEAAAEVLGVARLSFLDYLDSGMMGEASNNNPACFWQAPVDQAAKRLAAILREEQPDLMTVYDEFGGYGHPDHIQVHRVGYAAAALVGLDEVYEATINRDLIRPLIAMARQTGLMPDEGDEPEFGMPEDSITHAFDALPYVGLKRKAMVVHQSQIQEDSIFLTLPEDHFSFAFGVEHFIKRDSHAGAPFAPLTF